MYINFHGTTLKASVKDAGAFEYTTGKKIYGITEPTKFDTPSKAEIDNYIECRLLNINPFGFTITDGKYYSKSGKLLFDGVDFVYPKLVVGNIEYLIKETEVVTPTGRVLSKYHLKGFYHQLVSLGIESIILDEEEIPLEDLKKLYHSVTP